MKPTFSTSYILCLVEDSSRELPGFYNVGGACADPGIFVRGGPGQSDKKSSDVFCFSPQLILQKSNGQFQRNLSFFKVPEGVQHFSGGSNFFQGGPIAYSL